MRIDILTLFPDAVEASLKISILGRAEKKGILDIHAVQDPRLYRKQTAAGGRLPLRRRLGLRDDGAAAQVVP